MPKNYHGHWDRDRGAGFRHKRSRQDADDDNSQRNRADKSCVTYNSPSNKRMQRPPPHLRGKEIGLWYAKQSMARKNDNHETFVKSMGTVVIPPARTRQIKDFLAKLPPLTESAPMDGNYDHMPESKFKRQFLELINTDIREKLASLTNVSRDPFLDEALQQQFHTQQKSARYMSMQQQRINLPAYKMRDEIVAMIKAHQVVIVCGETGCGKTTQIPQFILDEHLAAGDGSLCRIVCSQPRRISAISVAERVADERGQELGDSVGYQIRLEKVLPRTRGSICFCTTGVILKHMEGNIGLDGVSHLVLDEIHERDVLSDFILALLKQILTTRTNLKVILMSATLNAEKFARYFEVDSIIRIPGFTHEVTEYYLEDALLRTGYTFPEARKRRVRTDKKTDDEFRDFIEPHVRRLESLQLYPTRVCKELLKEESEMGSIELSVALVKDICLKEKDPGAILVFLTGYADIAKMHTLMQESGAFPASRHLIIPLHSQMASAQQKAIFKAPPPGVRKIILATNIAETSITIEDVVFVIDCGKIKITDFNSSSNEDSLQPTWVSKANADQRRGRAGRVRPGVCYHLFSKVRNMCLDAQLKPELLRKRLDEVILNLKLLQLGDAEEFLLTCIDTPEVESVRRSVEFLKRLNALDENEVLTPLGYHLARIPVAPQMGKMMLLGAFFSCFNPCVNIASSLDFKDPFLMPLGKEDLSRQKKRELADRCMSDHLLFHSTLTRFETAYNRDDFCWEFFLSKPTLAQLMKMKVQFAGTLRELNFLGVADAKASAVNVNSENISLIKAITCASLYPNVCYTPGRISKVGHKSFFSLNRQKLDLHPKSVIMKNEYFDSPFMVYYRKVRSTSDYIHDASIVHTLPLLFFGDRFKSTHEENTLYVSVNDRLRFKTNEETLSIISELRRRLNAFLMQKACQPAPVDWENEEEVSVLKAIIDLITIEHAGYNPEDFD